MEIRYKGNRPEYNKKRRPKPYQLLTVPRHVFVEIQHIKKFKKNNNKFKTDLNLAAFWTDSEQTSLSDGSKLNATFCHCRYDFRSDKTTLKRIDDFLVFNQVPI